MWRIDLHTHSTASDGTDAPADVIRAAAQAGLDAVALTDHDTTRGWDAARAAALEVGITFIPGIEFSTRRGHRSIHVLGYLVDPQHAELSATLQHLRDERSVRGKRIAEALAVDYPLTWADVLEHAEPGATIGRPHLADTLVTKGIVADRSEAFATILSARSPYYVPQDAPDPAEAIHLIRAAGGVPVVAHPVSQGRHALSREDLEQLVDAGLMGVEEGHRENTPAGREMLRRLAAERDLILTGSSDYHGLGKPNRLGEHLTSPEQFARLLAAGHGSEAVIGQGALGAQESAR